MNRVFRVVWNRSLGAWQVASEVASSQSRGAMARRGLALTVAALGLSGAVGATGLPTDGQVVAGQASVQSSGATMRIEQSTQRAVIDWQDFSVGQGQRVEFHQPNASASTLNRVLGSNVSLIQGQISANGQVFLVNPNGVLFTPTAQVDVGAMVASTLNITNDDFMAGRYAFAGDSEAAVENQGQLNAKAGGTVALIAAKVINSGEINAPQGLVALAAGRKVRLDLGGPATIEVEEGALDALIEQGGAIRAAGGQVMLTARAARDLVSSVINHEGLMDVSSIDGVGGLVVLEADSITLGDVTQVSASGALGGGEVLIGGGWQGSGPWREANQVIVEDGANIKANATRAGDGGQVVMWSLGQTEFGGRVQALGAPNGLGGSVETSGAQIRISPTAEVQTDGGHWLIDPVDIDIDTTLAQAIISGLASNSVVISTNGSNTPDTLSGQSVGNGDITVSAPISWASANKLTLAAHRNIQINANIDAGNNGQLELQYGLGGAGGEDYALADGVKINLPDGSNFFTQLGSNAGDRKTYSVFSSWASLPTSAVAGSNFALGSDIASETLTLSSTSDRKFGSTSGALSGSFTGLGHSTVLNINFSSPTLSLFGMGPIAYMKSGVLRDINLDVTYGLSKSSYLGGAVGRISGGEIRNVHVDGTILSSTTNVGGVIGGAVPNDGGIVIRDSSFSGDILQAGNFTGGFIGNVTDGSYAIEITDNRVSGVISVSGYSGGFAGQLIYPTRTPTQPLLVQGNVVDVDQSGSRSGYYYGFVHSASDNNLISYSNNTWNKDTSGINVVSSSDLSALGVASTGTSGKIEGVVSQINAYLRLISGSSYYGETPNITYALYDASTGGNLIDQAIVAPIGTVTWSGTVPSATSNQGTYSLTYGSGITLGNAGYALNAGASADWTVNARPITLTAANASRVYGENNPTVSGFTLLDHDGDATLPNSDAISAVTNTLAASALTTANAGSTHAITPSSAVFSSGSASNYAITYADGALTIDPRDITLAATAASKTYGEADPTLVVTVSNSATDEGLATGDTLADVAGTLSRSSGEDVGSYNVALGTGAKVGNYNVSFNASNGAITINPRDITLAATAASKTYGEADPTLAVTVSNSAADEGLATGDTLADVAGTLSRSSGEAVGSYNVALGTGAKVGNYNVSFNASNGAITINPRDTTLAATEASKSDGEADPSLAVTVSKTAADEGLASGDSIADVAGALSRSVGEAVDRYDVVWVTGAKVGNYSLGSRSGGMVLIPLETEQAALTEASGVRAATKGEPAALVKQAQQMGFMGMLVVDGGVSLPVQVATQIEE